MASDHGGVFAPRLRFVRYGRIATNATIPRISGVGYKRQFGSLRSLSASSPEPDKTVQPKFSWCGDRPPSPPLKRAPEQSP